MSWFGKIMGGIFGFMLGGPIGALVGASLGHTLIDDKTRAGYSEQGRLTGQEQRQTVFFTLVVTLSTSPSVMDSSQPAKPLSSTRTMQKAAMRSTRQMASSMDAITGITMPSQPNATAASMVNGSLKKLIFVVNGVLLKMTQDVSITTITARSWLASNSAQTSLLNTLTIRQRCVPHTV